MREQPAGLAAADRLLPLLAETWGLAAQGLEHMPVGAGSYHWSAWAEDGARWFLCVDDLDAKPWLGQGREERCAGLVSAFETACALRDRAHLEFVVPPLRTLAGAVLQRIDDRHTLAVLPYLDGRTEDQDRPMSAEERREAVHLLARLHRATPAVSGTALHRSPLLEHAMIESALRALGRPWHGGPLAEPLRVLLAERAHLVRRALEAHARMAAEVMSARRALVVTHGEPHPGNVVRVHGRPHLVDWDTAALALPERDLWSLAGEEDEAIFDLYTELTGTPVDAAALRLYRLGWDLTDLALFVTTLRSPHEDNADTRAALGYVAKSLDRLG